MDASLSTFTTSEPGPTVQDVLQAKMLLQRASTGVLPLEVVDLIIDFAEYWPHTSNICRTPHRDAYGSSHEVNFAQDRFTCRSLPVGYPPIGPQSKDIGGFLQAGSNFSTQPPYATPSPESDPNPDLEAKRIALLDHFASQSLPRGQYPCRKIVFTMKSHDQGWGGDPNCKGTYQGSFTWFEAGLERLEIFPEEFVDLPLVGEVPAQATGTNATKDSGTLYTIRTILPTTVQSEINPKIYKFTHPVFGAPETCLQVNKAATSESQVHVVTWSYDDAVDPDPESAGGKALVAIGRGVASGTGEFVRNLKIGDIVTVWARARYPGWKNVVEDVKVDLYWAV